MEFVRHYVASLILDESTFIPFCTSLENNESGGVGAGRGNAINQEPDHDYKPLLPYMGRVQVYFSLSISYGRCCSALICTKICGKNVRNREGKAIGLQNANFSIKN